MKKTTRFAGITSRAQLIQRVRRELEARGSPRLQMFLLVALTGGAGFIASYALLTLGVDSLPLRYFISVAIAYLAFLLLLWIWLRAGHDAYDGLDEVVTEIIDAIPRGAVRTPGRFEPGGGKFGGAGNSGHWEASSYSEPLIELPEVPVPDLGAVAETEELAIPLTVLWVVAAVMLGILMASVSVVWSAPILFAELLVDGVLSATLYRRLRRIESRHWLQSALRRTVVPFAVTAVLAAAVGWAVAFHSPEARTLGEVFHTPG